MFNVHAIEIESESRMQEFDHQTLKRHWDGIRKRPRASTRLTRHGIAWYSMT